MKFINLKLLYDMALKLKQVKLANYEKGQILVVVMLLGLKRVGNIATSH